MLLLTLPIGCKQLVLHGRSRPAGQLAHAPPACPVAWRSLVVSRASSPPSSTASPAQPAAATGSSSSGAPGGSSSGSSSSSPVKDVFDPEFAKGLIEELQDQSQLGQRGEGWTVAQFVAIALVVWPPFPDTELTTLVGVLLLLGGLATIASGLQNLGTSLTPLPMPRKDSQLVTSGAYGYMRHPMYGGLLMSSLGLAAVSHDESRLLAAVLLWLVLEQKVSFEEKLLTERYGAAYEQYQRTVKKFLPYLY